MATALKRLPPPPQTCALTSTTFRPPLLDGTLTLPQIYDWHAQNTPNHILFRYAENGTDGPGKVHDILWPEAVAAVRRCAVLLREVGPAMDWSAPMKPIVAIISGSDTIPYFTTIIGTMYANYVPFPISPRNSPAAVAHLIANTNVSHILAGREPAMRELVDAAITILTTDPTYAAYQAGSDTEPKRPLPSKSDMFVFPELFTDEKTKVPEPFYTPTPQDEVVVYLHSSGSTAFPKPIPWTNYRFAQVALIPFFGERDLTGVVFSLHVMPMFHGMGVLQVPWAASCGLVVSAFAPASPPPLPNPDTLFSAAKACNADIIFCVPSFIEQWARKPEYVRWLAGRDGVLYGGGPLNKEAGDYMTSQGVTIFILYGSTEGGIMSPILPAAPGTDWQYFRFPDLVTPRMVSHSSDADADADTDSTTTTPESARTFELIMVENPICRPSVINTKVGGIDAYATSDLLVEHPTKRGYWRIWGRADDQIMHNTGEKTNPGPLENILNQDPHVLSSVMFGRGKFQAGVLVDLRPAHAFDPADKVKLAEMRNAIWPTVERINAFAPQHSRLFKETILFASPSKPFTYTAKNTARRQAIINDYEPETEAMYALLEESTQSSIPPPRAWTRAATTEFVRRVVAGVLTQGSAHGLAGIADDADLFQHGCDSLQATWIRNSILRALRDDVRVRVDTRGEVSNFVYEHPTVDALSAFVVRLAGGGGGEGGDKGAKAEEMRRMVQTYAGSFASGANGHTSAASTANGTAALASDVVLLTGSTGRLGCYLLHTLLASPSVTRIYAFNRPSKDGSSLLSRQGRALAEQGIDAGVLDEAKVVLVEGDLSVDGFGLETPLLNEMRGSVTRIIHNAWQLDFNLSLTSFEANVRGLRHLVDLALSARHVPKFVFISSIGVFQTPASLEDAQLESHIPPEVAIGTGYTESKWVSEQVLREAAATTALRPVIVRVGQLSGGPTGAWNASEWVPAMVQSAGVLGCIPDDAKDVAWIAPHHTASAIVDLSHLAPPPDEHLVHLVHPRPVPWDALAAALAAALPHRTIKLVPYTTWLRALEDHARASAAADATAHSSKPAQDLRAVRLLPFFRALQPQTGGAADVDAADADAFGFPRLSTTRAVALSATMRNADNLQRLGGEDVKMWVAYWRRVGHLA